MNRPEVENKEPLDQQHRNHKLGKAAEMEEVPPEGYTLSLLSTSRRESGVSEGTENNIHFLFPFPLSLGRPEQI